MSDTPQLLLVHHLKALRLPTFLREYDKLAQQCAAEGVDHPRYLLRLAELELIDREGRMVERRIKEARFPTVKSLDSFDFTAIPSLNKTLVLDLARCEYIARRENVIAVGNSGTGKSHIALGLGLAACQKGLSVGFTTAAAMVHELIEARDEKRLLRLQRQLAGYKLLIIDELGYVPLSTTGAELLFEVFSQRYERGSTIVTSNLPFDEWTGVFGSERLTGALLDRLTHHVHILEMNGDSYRLKPTHLARRAVVYIRQSTPHQVVSNQESLRLQYALRERAHELGWHEADIDLIDADLGLSGASAAQRSGFKELVGRVGLSEVGLILSIDVTRLARNCSDWYPLLDICGLRGCLIADRDGVYDPGSANGRLLLGLKGMISELELHTIRSRLTAGLLAKAERGELALNLPIGLVRDPSSVVVKDPDMAVQERLELVFQTFLKFRTVAKVVRVLNDRGLDLPRRDRHGDLRWARATVSAVSTILQNPAYAGAFVYGCAFRSIVITDSGGR